MSKYIVKQMIDQKLIYMALHNVGKKLIILEESKAMLSLYFTLIAANGH